MIVKEHTGRAERKAFLAEFGRLCVPATWLLVRRALRRRRPA